MWSAPAGSLEQGGVEGSVAGRGHAHRRPGAQRLRVPIRLAGCPGDIVQIRLCVLGGHGSLPAVGLDGFEIGADTAVVSGLALHGGGWIVALHGVGSFSSNSARSNATPSALACSMASARFL